MHLKEKQIIQRDLALRRKSASIQRLPWEVILDNYNYFHISAARNWERYSNRFIVIETFPYTMAAIGLCLVSIILSCILKNPFIVIAGIVVSLALVSTAHFLYYRFFVEKKALYYDEQIEFYTNIFGQELEEKYQEWKWHPDKLPESIKLENVIDPAKEKMRTEEKTVVKERPKDEGEEKRSEESGIDLRLVGDEHPDDGSGFAYAAIDDSSDSVVTGEETETDEESGSPGEPDRTPLPAETEEGTFVEAVRVTDSELPDEPDNRDSAIQEAVETVLKTDVPDVDLDDFETIDDLGFFDPATETDEEEISTDTETPVGEKGPFTDLSDADYAEDEEVVVEDAEIDSGVEEEDGDEDEEFEEDEESDEEFDNVDYLIARFNRLKNRS